MSMIDDLRKLLQDLVTPQMRELAVKIEHLNEKIDGVEKRLTAAIAESRGEARAHAESIRAEVQSGVARIVEHLRIDQRVTALEEDRQRKELPEKQ